MIGRALAQGLATLLFATAAVFAGASGAMAASGTEEAELVVWARTGLYLEADGQFIVESFGTPNTSSLPNGRPAPVSGNEGAFSLRAGWRAARPLAFEIQYERLFNLLESYDVNLITLNARYMMLVERRYQPFIRIGFGAIWGDLPNYWTRKGVAGSVASQSSFVWKVGGGLDYGISDHLIASLYADWVIPTQDFHKLSYAAIGLGLRYKF